eukprot:TRINITY_DN19256_c0_g1_i1.p1 TRINITY_DN19256_c0_g1~~TRINITY_DN19256_c0_g1_i1.p1  ORF type:complete len:199 (+),score=51.64 TRINITY_DN19256_c0_g1_i1:27-599(+)
MALTHSQPYWARDLLRKADEPQEDDALKAAEAADLSRLNGSVRNSAELKQRLRAGEGGMVVDSALAGSYPGVLEDIKLLISTRAVRHVRPLQEKSRAARKSSTVPEDGLLLTGPQEYPMGEVLFHRFEPEVEAIKVDDDIREAFHATDRLQQGSVAARLAPKSEAEGPRKRVRRAPQKPRKVQNDHMNNG